jgi:hypothetical protein
VNILAADQRTMTNSPTTLFGFLRRLIARTGSHTTVATPQPTMAPRRDFVMPLKALAPSAHLDRVSAIIQQSFTRMEAVNDTQALARQQLDVADYALQNIMDELRAIMPGRFPVALKLRPIHVTPTQGAAPNRIAA